MKPTTHLSQLREWSKRICPPENYHIGRTAISVAYPENILLFSRTTLIDEDRFDNAHCRYVLICCLKTPGTLFIDEQTKQLPEKHALLVFPHQFHHYMLPKTEINWLYITFDLPSTLWLTPLRNRILTLQPDSIEMMTRLIQTWEQGANISSRNNDLLTCSLSYLLAGLVQNETLQPTRQDGPGLDQVLNRSRGAALMQHLNDYINQNISTDLSIRILAGKMGISASHLRLLVRTQIGLGLGQYINRIRINRAKRLLSEIDRPISLIADDCGFTSSQSFSRSFRRMTGQSPQEFRRRYQS